MKPKEFPQLETMTYYAIVGTSNNFCPESIAERLYVGLEDHKAYMQKNEGKHKSYIGDEFPATLIRNSSLRLPGSDIEYFKSL